MAATFRIVYHTRVKSHLAAIERKYHVMIRQHIEVQLSSEPDMVTRNRKPLVAPLAFEATWEIRFGPSNRFRVFYEVDRDTMKVNVLAIGEKKNNRLLIAGEEVF